MLLHTLGVVDDESQNDVGKGRFLVSQSYLTQKVSQGDGRSPRTNLETS